MQCRGVKNGDTSLVYVTDTERGIRRRPVAGGFVYVGHDGKRVTDPETLGRIRSLAIPPAWTDVWICSDALGHLQATGRDARGRKQYRYHKRWREQCEADKFDNLVAFGRALPAIRARVERDLNRRGPSKQKMVALVVRLLDETLLRVGNEEYARGNKAYGLTTLRDHHAEIAGSELRLLFRGKGGKMQTATVRDRRLARVVRRSQELPGETLFQYLDESGAPNPVTSGDVNEYLRQVAGEEFSAKDFRTWGGTLAAARELVAALQEEQHQARSPVRLVNRALDAAAAHLGNTRAVASRSYVHPRVVETFWQGLLLPRWQAAAALGQDEAAQGAEKSAKEEASPSDGGLSREEAALLALLEAA